MVHQRRDHGDACTCRVEEVELANPRWEKLALEHVFSVSLSFSGFRFDEHWYPVDAYLQQVGPQLLALLLLPLLGLHLAAQLASLRLLLRASLGVGLVGVQPGAPVQLQANAMLELVAAPLTLMQAIIRLRLLRWRRWNGMLA
jgi:hypothetical protein